MQTFSIRELGEHAGDLGRELKAGHLSLNTEQGKPLCVNVPFDEQMLQAGVQVAMAVNMFKSGDLTPGRAAVLAGMGYVEFLEYVSPHRMRRRKEAHRSSFSNDALRSSAHPTRARPVIVADSGPLFALAIIGQLDSQSAST